MFLKVRGMPRIISQRSDTFNAAVARAGSTVSPPESNSAAVPAPGVADRVWSLGTIALISCQLILVLLVINQFQLENRTFFRVMLLSTVGFVVHALLPLHYRLPVFTLLSLASIMVALGPVDGSYLVVLGLVLIAICHLPVRLAVRIVLLLGTSALFAVWRMQLLPAPWSVAIWPLLASMFMFRLGLYLYALRHDDKRPTPAQTLAYFFMLPNVCFPLYPVVDYSTFIRTYYDHDAGRIYTTGIRWIVRGLLHLILYRFVYLHLTSDPADLVTLGDLVRFLLATFLLYLRVSGQFHLCIGVLHLFGFRLPETHHLYYLAASFTDFWRRINIYWKDFMMKLVYYPSYFRLRRWGDNTALVLATIIVFLATWLLHSYQWFWLRGGFPFQPQDALFWGVLGALVVFGSLREMKRTRKRRLDRGPAWSAALALRRLGTFSAICVLWSLWSADSISAWLTMWMVAGNVTSSDLWLLAGLVFGGLLVAGRPWSVREADDNFTGPFYRQPALHSTALLLSMLVVGSPHIYSTYSPQLASTVNSLQGSTLNARDAALQHKGYYEKLDNASRMSSQLWNVQAQRPAHWVGLSDTQAYRVRADFLRGDLRPDMHIVFEDQMLTTNHWGMRDRNRLVAKPEGTYRIALLGPSLVMGSGVADDETFAHFLEDRLNRPGYPGSNIRYEVMNFGVAGYSLLQQLAMLEERAVMFQPDAVFITDSQRNKGPVTAHLLSVISSRVAIPYPDLDAMIGRLGVKALTNEGLPVPFENVRHLLGTAGIKTRMPWTEADRRLRPASDSFVQWALGRIATVTREHGAVPVFVALNNVMDSQAGELRVLQDADAAGFLVFSLLDVWQNRDKSALRIGEWDKHPNAAGNRVIADRLFELMYQHRSKLRLDAAAPQLQNSRAGR
jgi:D-alanyl-lipoteichoic acid acyltransferase DltB (MBOAT superfamily)